MLHDYIIGYLDRHGCENVEDLEGYAENLFSSSWRLYCRCSRCLVVTMGIFLFFVLFICLVIRAMVLLRTSAMSWSTDVISGSSCLAQYLVTLPLRGMERDRTGDISGSWL